MTSTLRLLQCALCALLVAACGGGGGGGGTVANSGGIGGTGVVAKGVMTTGSVILNGVRYEDTNATVRIDDSPKSSASLQDGMVIQLRGSISSPGSGSAQEIEAQIEVRGSAIADGAGLAASPQRFVVLGQTVLVDDQIVLSGLTRPLTVAAVNGTLLEIFGLRDATGRIRATRVETNPAQMGDPNVDEIRGVVSERDNAADTLFRVSGQLVNATAATLAPAGASFGNGDTVEVHCAARPCVNGSAQFVATLIEVEQAEDTAFQPGANQLTEVEGFVTNFTTHPGDFTVADVPVRTVAGTTFQGGLAADLADNIRLEVEGNWSGGRLVASKVEFKRAVVRLQGKVVQAIADQFTLRIAAQFDVVVKVDTSTQGGVPPVSEDCIRIRAERAGGTNTVIAGEIDTNCSQSDDHILQASVDAKAAPNLSLLGVTVNVTGAQFRDAAGAALSQDAFFNAVKVPAAGPPASTGSLVRIRFDENSLAVKEVELED